MATAEELLAAAVSAAADKTLVIDNDLRTIQIPPSVKNLGVESDDGVLQLHFRMPATYCGLDLTTFQIRVNYLNAKGESDKYPVKDAVAADGSITFSWRVSRFAASHKGAVKFIVCLKNKDAAGVVTEEFNTTLASLPVLEGLETSEAVVQENPDIIEAMLSRLDSLEANADATNCHINYVESMDPANKATLRDLATGNHVLYGYFSPFPGSGSTLILDNALVHVYREDGGSYVSWMAADGDVDVCEILVDAAAAYGHTYNRTKVKMMDVHALLQAGVAAARVADVTLLAADWVGEDNPYSQVVTIDGITANSQVDLTPNVEQLAIFYDKSLAFVTENENGVVTVYAIGQKPQNDYVIQATITEVST